MTDYRAILRLDSLKLQHKQIAESLGVSRTTVIRVLRRAQEVGLYWSKAQDMGDRAVSEALFPTTDGKLHYKLPDYEAVHTAMAQPGVTLQLLWIEYCDRCHDADELPYQLTQFKKYYRQFVQRTKATMHIQRKPGEHMEVDWAGQTAELTDPDTGEAVKVYLFVAALPYSGYAYAEAFPDQTTSSWIAAHVNAYKHFGGVTRILVPDNLKTGVDKHTKDEVVLNKTYQELAEHYGTAVIPTRVRRPKDKATVEGTVGNLSTAILAALRNQQFFALRELNEAVWKRLDTFNQRPFQKKEGSRAILFAQEKTYLQKLPSHPFELAEYRKATVQFNGHIQVDFQNYSVPFDYIKRKVDVRLTRYAVEVLCDGNRICSHPRLYGPKGQYSTADDHLTPNQRKFLEWNGDRFRKWAAKIGPSAAGMVEAILAGYKVEQQGYKACMGLLQMAETYTPQRLDAACAKALRYSPRPSWKSVQTILKSGQDLIREEESEPAKPSNVGFTRGAAYFGRGRD